MLLWLNIKECNLSFRCFYAGLLRLNNMYFTEDIAMLTQSDLFLAAAGFLSGLIKTGVGVGSGLVLLPTLALVFPAKVALGLGAPMLLASDIIGLHYYWKQWLPRRELTRLFLAIIPGLFIGIVLLPMIPHRRGHFWRTVRPGYALATIPRDRPVEERGREAQCPLRGQ